MTDLEEMYEFLNRKIVFPNFDGRSGYDGQERPFFCIRLTPQEGNELADLGFDAVIGSPNNPVLKVMLSSAGGYTVGPGVDTTPLPDAVDVVIRPWVWNYKGRKGVKAQLATVHVSEG